MRLNPWQFPSSSKFVFFSTHACLDLKFADNAGLVLALSLLSWLLTLDPTSYSALLAWMCMADYVLLHLALVLPPLVRAHCGLISLSD